MHTEITAPTDTRASTAARIGAITWLVAAAQLLVVQLIVQTGWNTPYSWAENNISDLGNVHCQIWDTSRPRYVCSPLHEAMNVSFLAHGMLMLAGLALTGVCWGRGAMSVAARILLAITAAGWVLVGLAPADIDEDLHVLGALFIMGLGNIGLLCTGFLRRESLLGRLRPITLVMAVTAIGATALFFGQVGIGIGLGGLERVAAFTVNIWSVTIAVAVLRRGTLTASPGGPDGESTPMRTSKL